MVELNKEEDSKSIKLPAQPSAPADGKLLGLLGKAFETNK